MVAYGPWVQDVDHLQWWTVSDSNTDNYEVTIARVDDFVDYQDPVAEITPADLEEVYDAAQAALSNKGAWINFLSSAYYLIHPEWRSEWGCEIWAKEFYIGSKESVYHPSNYGFVPPAGAIGIDYATQPYTPETAWYGVVAENVAARLRADTEFVGKFEDDSVDNAAPLPWSSTTSLMVTPVGGVKEAVATLGSPPNDTTPNWLLRDLDQTVDLATYGALNPAWTATLHTETHNFLPGPDPSPYHSTRTRYGWMLNTVVLEIDFRPPLYRWVYKGSDTYRRNYPRDDGLAGGARRNYPPSKSAQSGNRNVGGYL